MVGKPYCCMDTFLFCDNFIFNLLCCTAMDIEFYDLSSLFCSIPDCCSLEEDEKEIVNRHESNVFLSHSIHRTDNRFRNLLC